MNGDIGFVGLAISTVLIAVAVAVSVTQQLGLERPILWAATRAFCQLMLVGLALDVIIDPRRPIVLSWLWVAAMVLFAAGTTARRAPEVPGVLGLSLVAYTLAAMASLGVLLGLGVFPVSGRTIVPLAGMVVGNSLAATVLVGRRIVAEFSEKRAEVESRLALGQSPRDAGRPYVRLAVRTALIPQIETTKAVGIVFLPGAMVGLILAGVEPLAAVKVQAAVMYLILGSVSMTTTVVALGLARRLFTADERLVRIGRPAGS